MLCSFIIVSLVFSVEGLTEIVSVVLQVKGCVENAAITCQPCGEMITKNIYNALEASGGIGLFFSFTEVRRQYCRQ